MFVEKFEAQKYNKISNNVLCAHNIFQYYIDFVLDKYSDFYFTQKVELLSKIIYNLNMFFNRF